MPTAPWGIGAEERIKSAPLSIKGFWKRKWFYYLLAISTATTLTLCKQGWLAIIIMGVFLYFDNLNENTIYKDYQDYLLAIKRSKEVKKICSEIEGLLDDDSRHTQDNLTKLSLSLLKRCDDSNELTMTDEQLIYQKINTLLLHVMNNALKYNEISDRLEDIKIELEEFSNNIFGYAEMLLQPYFVTEKSSDETFNKNT